MSKKSQNPEKKLITTEDLKVFLKGKRVRLDCGHHHTQHFLSNTLVLTADGKTYCHDCYQGF